jgi:hypothetical protein
MLKIIIRVKINSIKTLIQVFLRNNRLKKFSRKYWPKEIKKIRKIRKKNYSNKRKCKKIRKKRKRKRR